MRFLILRETGFSTFMSIIAIVFAVPAIFLWMAVYDKDYYCLTPAIVCTVICIPCYILAFASAKKSVKKRAEAEAQYRAEHPDFFKDKK